MADRPARTLPPEPLLWPVLALLVLPLFTLWFTLRQLDAWDAQVLAAIEARIESAGELPPAQLDDALALLRALPPPSRACIEPGEAAAVVRGDLGELCALVRPFVAAKWVAVVAIGVAVLAALVAALCLLAARRARRSRHATFVIGWNVVRWMAALESVVQAALLTWLSYWVTALWFERYYPKVVAFAAVIGAAGTVLLLRALVAKVPDAIEVDATTLDEAEAPALWRYVRELSNRLKAPVPDHLLVGIDDSLFVTESRVQAGQRALAGRTLHLNLALLRQLTREEADAVLAHELAHLLDGDTGHGTRLGPRLVAVARYRADLQKSSSAFVVVWALQAFEIAFERWMARSTRAEELAADQLGASVTSSAALARALLKIGAFVGLRQRVEGELLASEERLTEVGIARHIAAAVSNEVASRAVAEALPTLVTPHPFDTHPPLAARLANLGAPFEGTTLSAVLFEPRAADWYEAIPGAQALEAGHWARYEARLRSAHDLTLACRTHPRTDEELRLVQEHFPLLTFAGTTAARTVTLDFREIASPAWPAPVRFSSIVRAQVVRPMLRRLLRVNYLNEAGGLEVLALPLGHLVDGDGFLAAFQRYHGRHKTMVEHLERSEQPRSSQS